MTHVAFAITNDGLDFSEHASDYAVNDVRPV